MSVVWCGYWLCVNMVWGWCFWVVVFIVCLWWLLFCLVKLCGYCLVVWFSCWIGVCCSCWFRVVCFLVGGCCWIFWWIMVVLCLFCWSLVFVLFWLNGLVVVVLLLGWDLCVNIVCFLFVVFVSLFWDCWVVCGGRCCWIEVWLCSYGWGEVEWM